MFVNVAEKRPLHHLLGAYWWHARENRAGLRELGIGEPTHGRGRGGRSLRVQRDRLRCSAPGFVDTGLMVTLMRRPGVAPFAPGPPPVSDARAAHRATPGYTSP
jgi:hypothetical protein